MGFGLKGYYTVLFIITFIFSGFSQQDSVYHIDLIDVQIPEALERLSSLSGRSISFNPDIFKDEEEPITLDTSGRFMFLLTHILADRPYAATRTSRGSVIIRFDKSKERRRVYGHVVDALTGESLMACNIYKSDRSVGTITNEYGFFSIKVPPDNKPLVFSYLGYEKYLLEPWDSRERKVKIKLVPNADLDEVLIFNNDSVDNSLTQQGILELNLSDIRNQPAAGGEEDVTTMIRVLPGVQSGADGIGGLFVRGGTDDQNLVTIDGSTLYFPSHIFGLYSLVNSSSLRRAVVSKDNHLVPSGKRLSSSIDLWSKEGNSERVSGLIQMASSSLRGVLEGPIGKSTSFIITGRRSLLTPSRIFPQEGLGRTDAQTDILFYDYSAKVSTRIDGQHQLIAHVLQGNDHYGYSNNYRTPEGFSRDELRGFNWGNNVYSLRYNVSIGNEAYLKTGVHSTSFNYNADHVQYLQRASSDQNRLLAARTSIHDLRIHADMDLQHDNEQYTRLGFSFTNYNVDQGLQYSSRPVVINDLETLEEFTERNARLAEQDGSQFDAYIEEILAIGQKTKFQLGLFTSIYKTESTEYLNLLPKLSLRHKINDGHALFLYAQRTAQNIHKFDVDAAGYPTSLWFLADDVIRPKINYLLSAQYHKRWSPRVQSELGVYWSKVYNLLFPSSATSVDTESTLTKSLDPIDYIQVLNGSSRGVEAKFIVDMDRWQARINYTFSDTDRENQESGAEVRPIQDRHHTADGMLQYKLSKGFNVSVVQSYGSPNPTQYSHASFDHVLSDGITAEIDRIEGMESAELNSIYRTDLNLQYERAIGPTTHSMSIGLYNVFNRRQELYKWIDTITSSDLNTYNVSPALSLGRQLQFRYSLHF